MFSACLEHFEWLKKQSQILFRPTEVVMRTQTFLCSHRYRSLGKIDHGFNVVIVKVQYRTSEH